MILIHKRGQFELDVCGTEQERVGQFYTFNNNICYFITTSPVDFSVAKYTLRKLRQFTAVINVCVLITSNHKVGLQSCVKCAKCIEE